MSVGNALVVVGAWLAVSYFAEVVNVFDSSKNKRGGGAQERASRPRLMKANSNPCTDCSVSKHHHHLLASRTLSSLMWHMIDERMLAGDLQKASPLPLSGALQKSKPTAGAGPA